jgi:hypothetical protein
MESKQQSTPQQADASQDLAPQAEAQRRLSSEAVSEWMRDVCLSMPSFHLGAQMYPIGSRAYKRHKDTSDYNYAAVGDNPAALREAFAKLPCDSSPRGLVMKGAPAKTTIAFRTPAEHKRKETIYGEAKGPAPVDRQEWSIPNQDATIGNVIKQALLEQGAAASFTVVQNNLLLVCEVESDSAHALVQSTLESLETHISRLLAAVSRDQPSA